MIIINLILLTFIISNTSGIKLNRWKRGTTQSQVSRASPPQTKPAVQSPSHTNNIKTGNSEKNLNEAKKSNSKEPSSATRLFDALGRTVTQPTFRFKNSFNERPADDFKIPSKKPSSATRFFDTLGRTVTRPTLSFKNILPFNQRPINDFEIPSELYKGSMEIHFLLGN